MKWNNLLEETVSEINVLLEQEGMLPLPDLFKHMTLAIFRKGPRNIGWFQQSAQTAFEFLVQHDFLSPNSNLNSMRLTSKGQQADSRHRAEPIQKSAQFDSYWKRFVG
jgi:hypothetical protein